MRVVLLVAFLCFGIIGCSSNYETEQLYGNWQGKDIGFTFNEDGTGELRMTGGSRNIGWRDAMGNTLEITAGGEVIMSNLTVKSVSQDTMVIETREMLGHRAIGEKLHTMIRVQE